MLVCAGSVIAAAETLRVTPSTRSIPGWLARCNLGQLQQYILCKTMGYSYTALRTLEYLVVDSPVSMAKAITAHVFTILMVEPVATVARGGGSSRENESAGGGEGSCGLSGAVLLPSNGTSGLAIAKMEMIDDGDGWEADCFDLSIYHTYCIRYIQYISTYQ